MRIDKVEHGGFAEFHPRYDDLAHAECERPRVSAFLQPLRGYLGNAILFVLLDGPNRIEAAGKATRSPNVDVVAGRVLPTVRNRQHRAIEVRPQAFGDLK